MTIGPTRKSELKQKSDEIERLMEEFFARDGHITVIKTGRTEYRPSWEANSRAAYEERNNGEEV